MMAWSRFRPFTPAVAALLVLASCGGGEDGAGGSDSTSLPAASSTTGEPTDTTDTTDTADTADTADEGADTAGEGIDTIEEIRPAVVQILAQGSLREFDEESMVSGGWSGSGFIIDPDGIVVTNNHVVTGAGIIEVVLDDGEEVAARVLGVSECNDLAVLQLTDPGPYPFLDWYGDQITPALDVYTAGFPLGEPEYTLTRGIVSKAEAGGDTPWASVQHVIEHDASIQPGNSGGPLVSADGQVVGVNYAGGNPVGVAGQFFAIAADVANPVVEQLRDGDSETIGVNGRAYGDGDVGGVWVAAVKPGSPASEAGVLAGDFITTLNGVPLDTVDEFWGSPTIEAYCDVLRSASPGQPISIEVYRVDTDEIWVGELNGDPMTLRYSFENEFGSTVGGETPDGTVDSYEYETVRDDTGTIVVSVPTAWAQRDTTPTDLGLSAGPVPTILAAPDLQAFNDTYDAPGMLMFGVQSGASEFGTPGAVLGLMVPDDPTCQTDGRAPWDDGVFVGELETWFCGSGSAWIAVAANPVAAPDALVVIGVVAVSDADLEALDEILWTFNFAGS